MSDLPSAQNAPATAPAPDPRGSLGLGIALAWACLIGGYFVVSIVSGVIFGILRAADSDAAVWLAVLLALLPWVAMIALVVWFAKNDKPRTALGVSVGIASILGVVLLLVAACFGLLANANFH
jgi:hypothetical protein